MSATPNDLKRLREHAEAAKSLSAAKRELDAADTREVMLSGGEHPDALIEAAHETNVAFAAYQAARAVERRAYIAYTNPFGVDKVFQPRDVGAEVNARMQHLASEVRKR